MIQYSTNLTDKQWQVIEKIINTQERKRKHSLRNIMNAILYLLKTGCQWRMIPKDFAPWESVYYYFSKWKNEGIIEELLEELEVVLRTDEYPSKFKVLPKRWIVERSFAWLENFRRLTIDYEYHADTAEAMVQLAFCKIMLNKFIG